MQDPPHLGDLPVKEEMQGCLLTQKLHQAILPQPHCPGFLEKPHLAEPAGSGVRSGLPTKGPDGMASASQGAGLHLGLARVLLTHKHRKLRLLPVLKCDLGTLGNADRGQHQGFCPGLFPTSEDLTLPVDGNAI